MKKITKKQPNPLVALFGFKPGTAIPYVTNLDTSVKVDLDWMVLHFGRDDQLQEFAYATAGKHHFLLCATPPEGGLRRKPAKTPCWVYLVAGLPAEMWGHRSKTQVLAYSGFTVTAGREATTCIYFAGREFVAVEMPSHGRTLLFRNPASSSTDAWTPRRATELSDATELRPGETALDLDRRLTGHDSTGDADLDALLNELK